MRSLILGFFAAAIMVLGAAPAPAQDCRLFNNCPKKQPPPPPPSPSPAPPVLSACDRLWPSVARRDDETGYRDFVSRCSSNRHAADANSRLAAIDAGKLLQAKQCDDRWSALQAAESTATSVGVRTFADMCSARSASPEFNALSSRVLTRERITGEAAKWGFSYSELCSLSGTKLLSRASVATRRSEMQQAARTGDSTANLLLGLDAWFTFYATGNGYSDAQQYIFAASNGGNARGMAERGVHLVYGPSPDYDAGDALLQKARGLGCGRASYSMYYRLAAGPKKHPPSWAASLTIDGLAQEALDRGYGKGACAMVGNGYDAKTNKWLIGPDKRRELYQKASQANDSCGEILLAVEGLTGNNNVPFGPCATNNYDCVRTRLRSLRDQFVAPAGSTLYTYLVDKKYGGSGTAGAEAIRSLEMDVQAGYDVAATSLGFSYAAGIDGIPVDIGKAMSWCYRGYLMGAQYGGACVGVLTPAGKPYLDAAYALDSCIPYYTAVAFMPPVPGGSSSTVLRDAVVKLPATRKALLKAELPMIRYAFSLSAGSSDVCASAARQWLTLTDDVVARQL